MEELSKNILNSLIEKLNEKNLFEQTVKDFVLLSNDNYQKVQFAENLLKEHNVLPNYDEFKLRKCKEKAEEFKDLGNQLYKDKKFYEALISYNKSLCYSPEDSQNVGIAFANRSAVYLAMGQYEKCIENIKLAKKYNYPQDKMIKLCQREEQATKNLNSFPDPNQKLIKYEEAREKFLKPKLKAKENLNFFVADCLEVKTSPEFGRYLITNQDLKVGSVIGVEKPFSKVMDPEVIYERCANCLGKNLLNLLPCFNCCSAMFCSEDCRSAAQEKFHKFECGLLNLIDEQFLFYFRFALRAFFEALHIFKTPSKLREFLTSIKNSNDTVFDFGKTDEASFRKNSLHAVSTLMTFEKSQNYKVNDLFYHAIISAIISNLMLNHSKPLQAVLLDDADHALLREFVFKYSQIAIMNVHGMYGSALYSPHKDHFGSGFYPLTSLMNHSCAPNIIRETFETSIYIVVTRPIKKGEQIFDNYGINHYLQPLKDRQKGLFQQYRFKCQCEACQNDYPMRDDLKVKDKFLFETLQKDYKYLERTQDLEVAVKNYNIYCKYIDKLNKKSYPCREIAVFYDIMSMCFSIFSKTESYEV